MAVRWQQAYLLLNGEGSGGGGALDFLLFPLDAATGAGAGGGALV